MFEDNRESAANSSLEIRSMSAVAWYTRLPLLKFAYKAQKGWRRRLHATIVTAYDAKFRRTGKVAQAAALFSAPASLAALNMQQRQAILENMSTPTRLGIDGSKLRYYVHSPTEDARIRKFKEPWTIEWLRSLPATAVLYDVGANIGITALIAAEALTGAIRVVAIEPAPANFASLVKNTVLNGLSQTVCALPIGLGSTTGVLPLKLTTYEPGGAMHSFGDFQPQKPGREVKTQGYHYCLCARLDDLVKWNGMPFPTHIKIDVDGSELDMLAGARRVFHDCRCRAAQIEVIDAYKGDGRSRKVVKFMLAAGFVVVGRYAHNRAFPRTVDFQFVRP
jgi:FkbM family methyltransferase